MPGSLDATRYASANARVRGLYAQLLDDETWRALLTAQGTQAAIDILKSTAYAEVIATVEQSEAVTLERIERELAGRAAGNVRKAMLFTQGLVRQLLLVWWQHFELENLKAVFRSLHQGMEPDAIRRLLIPLGEYSVLPWDALLNEHSVLSLIDRLERTHYINPLRNALPIYQREHSLFPIEIALDIRYYRDLAAAIEALSGDERVQARRVLGTRLDILNILWAYRYRTYYNLSAEEIVNYTLWRTVRTNTALIRDIALGADPQDIITRVWGPQAIDLTQLASGDPMRVLLRLELLLERFWHHLAQRELSAYPFSLGTILGYLVLEEHEAEDLVTLLEAKGLGWEPERIEEHLVRGEE